MTDTLVPATVNVPLRNAPKFVDTLNNADPLPAPGPPEMSAPHGTFVTAAHRHDGEVETLTVRSMASEFTVKLVGLTLNEQAA